MYLLMDNLKLYANTVFQSYITIGICIHKQSYENAYKLRTKISQRD